MQPKRSLSVSILLGLALALCLLTLWPHHNDEPQDHKACAVCRVLQSATPTTPKLTLTPPRQTPCPAPLEQAAYLADADAPSAQSRSPPDASPRS